MIDRNILFNLKKKLSSFKIIKLNKLFLKFVPVLYLNQINISWNQINNVSKIISFIQKLFQKSNFNKTNLSQQSFRKPKLILQINATI